MGHWFRDVLVVLGLTSAAGAWYLFWSGVYGALSLIVVGTALARKFNCHWPGCWYVAWRPHPDGSGVMVCRKHVPIALTAYRERLRLERLHRQVIRHRGCGHRRPATVDRVPYVRH